MNLFNLKHKIYLLLFLFGACNTWSQNSSVHIELKRTINIPEGTSATFLDGQQNVYFVNKDEISKFSNYSTPIKQSIKKWQSIDDIESINSLKIAVFSKSQQQLCFLDNTLSENGTCLNLDELGLLNVAALATSKRADMLWMYDELNSSLVLFNFVSKKEIQRVDNLQGILGISGEITLNENEYGLWISSSDGKICLMDDFMNVVRCASETNQAMIPYADGFFFVNENLLYYRDLFEGVNEVYKIFTTENIRELYVSGNQIIARTSSELNVFIIQP
ncbi:MAG: hypothetical protein RLZZ198_1999 [Bacteroidota bacterium]